MPPTVKCFFFMYMVPPNCWFLLLNDTHSSTQGQNRAVHSTQAYSNKAVRTGKGLSPSYLVTFRGGGTVLQVLSCPSYVVLLWCVLFHVAVYISLQVVTMPCSWLALSTGWNCPATAFIVISTTDKMPRVVYVFFVNIPDARRTPYNTLT